MLDKMALLRVGDTVRAGSETLGMPEAERLLIPVTCVHDRPEIILTLALAAFNVSTPFGAKLAFPGRAAGSWTMWTALLPCPA